MEAHAIRPSAAGDGPLGQVLGGRYRLEARLGAGGMGVVYLAEHLLIRRKFAVKLMGSAHGLSDELVRRFQREALAAASMGHPHIVDVTDMGTADDGSPFLVLEYLDGQDLARAVHEGGLFSVGRAVRVALQLCAALGAVHEKRIVHRDLKPANIMLVPRPGEPDFVKVLDFGICKLLDRDDGEPHTQLTGTHASLGTPEFMAPEQFRGSARVDLRADLYAVGAVLYYMLTGRPPFEADDLPHLLMRICTEPPRSARMVRPDVPAELDLVLKRACAKRLEDRFESSAALAAALTPFARHPGEAPKTLLGRQAADAHPVTVECAAQTAASWPPPSASSTRVSVPRRRRTRAGMAVLGALVLVGCVALGLWRSGASSRSSGPERAQSDGRPAVSAPDIPRPPVVLAPVALPPQLEEAGRASAPESAAEPVADAADGPPAPPVRPKAPRMPVGNPRGPVAADKAPAAVQAAEARQSTEVPTSATQAAAPVVENEPAALRAAPLVPASPLDPYRLPTRSLRDVQ
jgi:serine/threonine-protein kinase